MDEFPYAQYISTGENPPVFPVDDGISKMEEQETRSSELEHDDGPARARRAKNFSKQEDTLLCSCWLQVGMDAVTGNQQTKKSFWGRVYEMYLQDSQTTQARTKISIEHHWVVIQASIVKFCGFYDSVVRLNHSGTTLQDKLDEACSLYEAATKRSFTMLHCWRVLNKHQKWTATLSSLRGNTKTCSSKHNSSQSPDSFSAINLDESSPLTECDVSARPCGHKAAKKRSRDAKPSGYEDVMIELSTRRKETEEKWASRHAEVVQLEERKLELRERHLRVEEERVREERLAREERIMTTKLDGMDEGARQYYLKMKKKILES